MYWEEVNQTCTFSTLKVWSSSVQGCLFCRKELTKFSANADGIKLLLCLWGFFPKLLFFSAESRKQWGHGGCLRTDLNINRLNSAFPLRNAFRVNQSVFPFFHLFATNIGSCTYLEAWNIESFLKVCICVSCTCWNKYELHVLTEETLLSELVLKGENSGVVSTENNICISKCEVITEVLHNCLSSQVLLETPSLLCKWWWKIGFQSYPSSPAVLCTEDCCVC